MRERDHFKGRIVAIELRGHGETRSPDDADLSSDTIIRDLTRVLYKLLTPEYLLLDSEPLPPAASTTVAGAAVSAAPAGPSSKEEAAITPVVFVVGHSFSGGIGAHWCSRGLVPWLGGMVVMDVVESVAVDAFPCMMRLVESVKDKFDTLSDAIRYAMAKSVSNMMSAVVSVPRQFCHEETGEIGSVDNFNKPGPWIHRTRLDKTQAFWAGWYEGMTGEFLSLRAGRMLIVSSIRDLGRDMTIAQMQGKFHIVFITQSGHLLMEDNPSMVGRELAGFIMRNVTASRAGLL